jgi:arylsulfatase
MGAPKVVADGGFDHSYVLHDHDRYFTPKNHELDDQQLAPIEEGANFYVTTAIANYTIDFLKEHAEKHRDQPFYGYLAFTSPHFPLHAKNRYYAYSAQWALQLKILNPSKWCITRFKWL